MNLSIHLAVFGFLASFAGFAAAADCPCTDCEVTPSYTGSLSHLPPTHVQRFIKLKEEEIELVQQNLAAKKLEMGKLEASLATLKRELEALRVMQAKFKTLPAPVATRDLPVALDAGTGAVK